LKRIYPAPGVAILHFCSITFSTKKTYNMTAKLIFICAFTLTGSCILNAQAPASLHTAQAEALDIHNTIQLLEQNALLALIGAVGLMAMVWFCAVMNACKDLNKPQKNTPKTFASLLILVAGLSVFCGSCSVEQRAMATEYRAAQAAETRNCAMSHHDANAPFSNGYPSNGFSNMRNPVFCKYCGKRIANHH
jgi:hypothetical protein